MGGESLEPPLPGDQFHLNNPVADFPIRGAGVHLERSPHGTGDGYGKLEAPETVAGGGGN